MMKLLSYLTAVCVFLFGSVAMAAAPQAYPTQAGSVSLSGGFSFESVSFSGESDGMTVIHFTPGAHLFLFDGFSLGFLGNYADTHRGDLTVKEYGIGPVVRAYVTKPNSDINPYLFAAWAWNRHKEDGGINSEQSDFSVGLGLDFMANPYIAFEPYVSYHVINVWGDNLYEENYWTNPDQTRLEVGVGLATFFH